ncbi:MAG: SDR family oxidoreductase [Candidatus Tectomicrobia bacterium]|nr:SDR family oxidoreductase [Candidatus Tectomicrobia bacterium]
MVQRFVDRVALVTGAASGIGKAIALNLAQEGADVVAADKNAAGVQATCRDIEKMGRKALPYEVDVAQFAQLGKLVQAAIDRFGKIHVLMNVAGISPKETFLTCTEALWDRTHDINLKSYMFLSQAVAPHMIKQKDGRIVSIASSAGEVVYPNLGPYYHTSKAGVIQLTRYMAQELAPHGIRVNAIGPGLIETPMTEETRRNEAVMTPLRARVPMKRWGKPEEIARVALFLASDDASYVTGETLFVDGGLLTLV